MFKNILFGFVFWSLAPLSGMALESPRLVVLVVVDQLHPELLARFHENLAPNGGFNRFLDGGLQYPEAYVDHFLTLTGTGHASISTGAPPSQHGIVGNYWYDQAEKAMTSSVSDGDYRLVGIQNSDWGVSPRKLRAQTFADRLFLVTDGQGKTLSISGKDRGAVLIAGQKGQAFWYSTETGGFVSSTYYFDRIPKWVSRFNKKHGADAQEKIWTLMHPKSKYRSMDKRDTERPPEALDNTFPHDLGEKGSAAYYRVAKRVPMIDNMVLSLAVKGIDENEMGSDDVVDFLSVSLSATDYVGHDFGPYSRESEDNLYRLDRVLAQFMDEVEKRVSAKDVLYVLTADHGVDASPEHRRSIGLEGHRLEAPALTEALNHHLMQHFKIDQKIVQAAIHTGVYFEPSVFEQVPRKSLALETKRYLEALEAVESALILPEQRISDEFYDELLQKTLYHSRVGDVFIVPAYGTFFGYPDNAATHGTPYLYDRHIPLIFLTGNRDGKQVWDKTNQRAIVPTLTQILGVGKPSSAGEAPLTEVIGEYQ